MHEIKKKLLSRLRNQPSLSYADLTRGYNADNNVVFHLRKLLEAGYIVKDQNKYKLTVDGVKSTANFEISTLDDYIEKQVIFGLVVKMGENYLIKKHENAKIPFINLPSGIGEFGLSVNKNIEKIINSSLGIETIPSNLLFDSLHMKRIVNEKNEIIFDDVFPVYSCNLQEQSFLLPDNMQFMSKSEIERVSVKWPEIDSCILGENWLAYSEYEVQSEYIL